MVESNSTLDPQPVKVSYRGSEVEFPVRPATCGASSMDLSSFTKHTGLTALDYGFVNVASAKSAITFIDGAAGILRYRGYAIEDLALKAGFLEVAWLLIYGELPSRDELESFQSDIARAAHLHEDMRLFFNAMPWDAHQMSVLAAGVSALSTYYQDSLNSTDPDHLYVTAVRLIAKLPVIAAYALKKFLGRPFLYPDQSLGYVESFMRLCFGDMSRPFFVNPDICRALETLLILHEDHEQNASTSTVRLVGSTGANIYASVSAGINALFGPLHGGANEAVLRMLQQIKDSGRGVRHFVKKVKNRESGVRLMGFGHRVYKNYDPRARIVKDQTTRVLELVGVRDGLLDIAMELEQIALADEYFQERKLYPNVDFYTGVIYKAIGFPTETFTVLFALGRLPGWIAHWHEMSRDPKTKIGRPQQLYVGHDKRDLPSSKMQAGI